MARRRGETRGPHGGMVDFDYEPRPNLNVKVRGRPKRRLILNVARRVLEQVKKNIRTAMGGRWLPIQWGSKKGQRALQGTEDTWLIDVSSTRSATVRPKKVRRVYQMWSGHIQGSEIRPRNAKALRFIVDGQVFYRKKVKLPKRDPRPTVIQMQRIME